MFALDWRVSGELGTRLVFGFGGHGQRRQRREGGGEQPPQLQGTVGSFYRLILVHNQ